MAAGLPALARAGAVLLLLLPLAAATGITAQQDESRFTTVKVATDRGGVSHPACQVNLLRHLLGTTGVSHDNSGPGTAGGSHSGNGYHWGGGKGWRWPRPQPIDKPPPKPLPQPIDGPAPTKPWPETFVEVKPMAAGQEGHRRRQLLGSQHNGGSNSGGSDSDQGGDDRRGVGNSWGGGKGWPGRSHPVPKPLPTPIDPPEHYPEDPPAHPGGGKGWPRPLPVDRPPVKIDPPVYVALDDQPAAKGHRLLLGAGHSSDGNGAGRDSGRGSGSSDGDDGEIGATGGRYWGGDKGFPRHFPKGPPFHTNPQDPPDGWGGKHPKPIPIEDGPGGPVGPKPIPIEDGPGGPDMHHMG